MRNYARFQGRSPRVEFFEVFGGLFLLLLVAQGLDRALLDDGTGSSALFVHLVILAHILPVLAVTARRLHDLDWSGWFTLLNLVPVLGFVLLLLVLPRGVRGPNRYGPDPLDPAADATPPQQPLRPSPAAPPSSITGASAATAPVNVIGELERLAELHRTGSLSEAEFAVMKAQILARAG
jgi:uncharacterized membrane protein YhaH (DUF805 family)